LFAQFLVVLSFLGSSKKVKASEKFFQCLLTKMLSETPLQSKIAPVVQVLDQVYENIIMKEKLDFHWISYRFLALLAPKRVNEWWKPQKLRSGGT
jgi:hypothetical protein